MVALIIVCLVIIGFLGYRLYQKKTIDTQLADEYQNQIAQVKEELRVDKEALSSYQSKLLDIQVKVNTERQKLTDLYNQLDSAQTSLTDARTEYHNLVNERIQEIDQLMDEQRRRRQESLDETFNEKKSVFQAELQKTLEECDKQAEDAKKWMAEQIEEAQAKVKEYCGNLFCNMRWINRLNSSIQYSFLKNIEMILSSYLLLLLQKFNIQILLAS